MDHQPEDAITYGALMRVEGFGRLAVTTLLGRAAEQMWTVVMVLFVLQKFGSPALAGLVFFLGVTPGLLLSPLAGALLDRHGRLRFILFDYAVATASLVAIVALSARGMLSPAWLVPLVICGGVTGMLSAAGLRSMLPLMLPRRLWDRGNAFDSAGYTIVAIAAPAAGGALVGLFGGEAALLVTAAVFGAGALSVIGMREPPPSADRRTALLRSAVDALLYVVRNRTMRGLATTLMVLNVGAGVLVVALPVLVLGPLGGTPAQVGLVLALQGAGGVVSALVFGRVRTEGRERRLVALFALACAGGTAMLLAAGSIWLAGLASLVIGASIGPLDVCIFSLRQRSVDVAWMGRAIAVSMSLNFVGYPIGSALSGPLLGISLTAALMVSTVLTAAAAAVALVMLPGRRPAPSLAPTAD